VCLFYRIITIFGLTLLTLESVFAQQTVQLRLDVRPAGAGQYQAEVYYSVANQSKTTGLGVNLYFDAGVITDMGITDVYAEGVLSNQIQPDTDDEDQDSRTDYIASVAWLNIGGSWPGDATGETLLFKLNFSLADPDTPTETIFRFSGSLPAGYDLSADSYSYILPQPNNPPRGADNLVQVTGARVSGGQADHTANRRYPESQRCGC